MENSTKLTKLQESILTLYLLQGILDEYKICLDKEKRDDSSTIYSIIANQIILTSCSYIEEWKVLGSLSTVDSRIIKLRRVVKPAMDRINKWEDLKRIRNHFIAHNLRIPKSDNASIIFHLESFKKVPVSYYDLTLLMMCIYITKIILFKMFKEDVEKIIPPLKNIKDVEISMEIKKEKDFKKEKDRLIKEIETNMDNYKIS